MVDFEDYFKDYKLKLNGWISGFNRNSETRLIHEPETWEKFINPLIYEPEPWEKIQNLNTRTKYVKETTTILDLGG